MKAGEALSTVNSRFKAELQKKTSWGRNEILEVWTAVLLEVMVEAANGD